MSVFIQQEMVKAAQELGKPIIVVLINGRPLAINWIDENVPANLAGQKYCRDFVRSASVCTVTT